MNNNLEPHHFSEEIQHAPARLIADDAALAAFKTAALNNDLWQQSQAKPRGYFASARNDIQDSIDKRLSRDWF
jgi:hypothetical protein